MPGKNSIKEYEEGGFYHIYNRGVAKQEIFLDSQDYKTFTKYLMEYLLPPDHTDLKRLRETNPNRKPINCSADVKLLAYTLMPNHFHLLIENLVERGIERFMRALGTSFTKYFNLKYDRVGHVFQGRYKAVKVRSDDQLLYVSKYIHVNPREILWGSKSLEEYLHSSYRDYVGEISRDWIDINEVLSFYNESKDRRRSYKSFVEEAAFEEGILDSVTIDANQ